MSPIVILIVIVCPKYTNPCPIILTISSPSIYITRRTIYYESIKSSYLIL